MTFSWVQVLGKIIRWSVPARRGTMHFHTSRVVESPGPRGDCGQVMHPTGMKLFCWAQTLQRPLDSTYREATDMYWTCARGRIMYGIGIRQDRRHGRVGAAAPAVRG